METISSTMIETIKMVSRMNSKGDCFTYCHFLSLMKKLTRRVITKTAAMISSRIIMFSIHRSDRWKPYFRKIEIKAAIPNKGVI
jgi:hypothetical protein